MTKKARTKKPAKVTKIIKKFLAEPEKAQIEIHEGEHLYSEIRVENTLKDEAGNSVKLKEGADVDVVVEADSKDTTDK